MTCAICVGEQGPFHMEPIGKNDAMVRVCEACATEPARAFSNDRGYEIREGMSVKEMARRIDAVGVPGVFTTPVELVRSSSPGWIVVRVNRRTVTGKQRDHHDALLCLQGEPWATSLRYLGSDLRYFLFERPGPVPTPSSNPLADIERWRTS